MKKYSVETAVGIFVLIGIACIGYLTIKLGKMELLGSEYYSLQARFESVEGLKPGAEVRIAGVVVGKVEIIELDKETQDAAIIGLKLNKDVQLTDDVIASVKTSGLIGDKFIKLSPGGSDVILAEGDMITETESSLDIEELVSKYVFGGV